MLLLFVRHNYFWKFLSPSLRSSLPTHCALSVPSAKPDRENGILKNQKCTFEFFSVYKPKETGFFSELQFYIRATVGHHGNRFTLTDEIVAVAAGISIVDRQLTGFKCADLP